MRRVCITGSNRGIGLALTQQLLEAGVRVFATARHPEKAEALQALKKQYSEHLSIYRLDVTQEDQIEEVAHAIAQETDGLEWLVNNAGVLYQGEHITNLTQAQLTHAFQVNAFAPLLTTRYLLSLLERGTHPVVCQITSIMGSVSLQGGGYYSYRGSKAALNMMSRVLSHDLKPLGITVILMHPGWVRTAMGGPQAPLDPVTSASGIIGVLERVDLKDTGRFLSWDGKELPF